MNRRDRNLNKNSNITMQQAYQQPFKKGSARLYSQAAAQTSNNIINMPIGQSQSSYSIGRFQIPETQNQTGILPMNQQSQSGFLRGECSPISEEIEQKLVNKMPKIKDSLLSSEFKQNFSSYKDFHQNSRDDLHKQKRIQKQDQSQRYTINVDHIINPQIQVGVQTQKSSMPDIASRKNIQQTNKNYLNSLSNNRGNEINQKRFNQKKSVNQKIDELKIDKSKLIFQKSNADKFKLIQGPDDFQNESQISH